MSAAMGCSAVPGARVAGGAVPGLKARANPSRPVSAVGPKVRWPPRTVRPARDVSSRMSPAASGQGASRQEPLTRRPANERGYARA